MGVSFEENLLKLESSANALKENSMTLEEAMKTYEEGIKAYSKCNEILNDAKQKIEVLRRDG